MFQTNFVPIMVSIADLLYDIYVILFCSAYIIIDARENGYWDNSLMLSVMCILS